jgi:hypothetical protein
VGGAVEWEIIEVEFVRLGLTFLAERYESSINTNEAAAGSRSGCTGCNGDASARGTGEDAASEREEVVLRCAQHPELVLSTFLLPPDVPGMTPKLLFAIGIIF